MKHTRTFLMLCILGALTACSTVMPLPPQRFLTGNVESAAKDNPPISISRRATTTVDPSRVQIGEIFWAVNGTDLTDSERNQLLELLRTELKKTTKNLPASPSGRPVILRAAITRIETVSPALNVASTLLLVAPWDRGGAATEIEAIDAETGKQLAALRMGYFAPMSDIKARFFKLDPAEIAIKKTVSEFGSLLVPETGNTVTTRP